MIAKQAMSKPVGKMQIKEVTIATSHGSPPPGTCHTEFSVENKYNYLDTGPNVSQEASGRGQTKGKSRKATQSKILRAKLHSNDTTTHARGSHLLANGRSPS